MKIADERIQPLLADLLDVLDEQIVLEEQAVGHLRGMYEALLARDDAAMARLMDEALATHERFASAETRRVALGSELADALSWDRRDATLLRIATETPGPQGEALRRRHVRIQALVGEVRRQHLRTASLLVECARLNRAVLGGLLPQADRLETYGTGGQVRRPGRGLLDTRS